MNRVLTIELVVSASILLPVLVIASLFGVVFEVFALVLVLYLSWTFYNLNKLIQWLHSQSNQVPDSMGVWDEVYYRNFLLYKRQRKAKKRLRSILSMYRESTQALPFPTIVISKTNEIEWFNPVAQQIFGLQAGRDTGLRIDNLIRHPKFAEYINRSNSQQPLEFEYDKRQLMVDITPVNKDQRLLCINDITLRHKLDIMRKDFIANASHELRTPLTVLSGYIESLLENDFGEIRKPLSAMEYQVVRMQAVLDALTVLAHLESTESDCCERVDVGALLKEIHEQSKLLDGGKHRIRLEVQAFDIYGDRKQLHMAFSNLVSNAIYYTPDGGTIRIFCKLRNQEKTVGVEDSGIGIPQKHIPRLTERFYRVDSGRSRKHGGTGLGLAIVKHILERHDAKLSIRSRVGRGSVFRCLFPGAKID